MVYGLVVSRTITLTNVGHSPVSFTTAHRSLAGTGFSVDLGEKVRSLPGAPDPEALEFTIRFDPAAILCPEGHVETGVPFNVSAFGSKKKKHPSSLVCLMGDRLDTLSPLSLLLQLVGGPTSAESFST